LIMSRGVDGNPIVHIEELRRLPIRRRRIPPSGTVQVYSGRGGALFCPPGGLTTGEQLWLGPRLVYDVDVTPHPLAFRTELSSADGRLVADVDVRIRWQTVAPVVVVAARVFDAATVAVGQAEDWLRSAAGQRSWTTVAELEALLGAGDEPSADITGVRVDRVAVTVRAVGPVDIVLEADPPLAADPVLAAGAVSEADVAWDAGADV